MSSHNDFKNAADHWVMTFNVDRKLQYTISGRRWCNMVSRTTPDGAYQRDKPSYVGCVNRFESFQDFANWSNTQVGSSNLDWHLDKDLLGNGKVYSRDNCVFIPQEINSFLSVSKKTKSTLPLGVYWKKGIKRFVANSKCPQSNKYEHLGTFITPEAAHEAYCKFKHKSAQWLANKWKDKIDPRAYEALMKYEVEIGD